MTFVPRIVASLANFERVQNYLVQAHNQDTRNDLKGLQAESRSRTDNDIQIVDSHPAVIVDNVTIQHSVDSTLILQNISFTIASGSLMICSGAVGSGKSSLAQLLLGEVSPSKGAVYMSTRRIGLCKQVPWLPSGSVREIICGGEDFDSLWYEAVLHACDLLPDLKNLPQDDETQIGSRGLNLSGGQRQRVVRNFLLFLQLGIHTDIKQALARAIYARCQILVLDDAFNALDAKTESNVIQRLLGSEGILKTTGTTVFMITHAGMVTSPRNGIIEYWQ